MGFGALARANKEKGLGNREERRAVGNTRVAARFAAALLSLLTACPLPALAASSPTAAFLKIPLDARAVGLGAGAAAVGEGVGAVALNPAGFGFARQQELALLYAPHLQGSSLGYLAYGRPTAFGSLGISHLSMRSGAMDGRDDDGRPTGSFSAEDRAIGVSWAAPLAGRVPVFGAAAVGVQAKFLTSRIGSHQASTYAFDLGAQSGRRVGNLPLRFGVALKNLGPGLALQERKDPLPLQLSLAVAAQPAGLLTVSAGASRYLVGERTELSLGTEVAPISGFFFRGNYGMLRAGGSATQNLPQLSWGLGMRLASWQVDYAMMPLGELGSTQRLNLTMRFGTPRAAPALLFGEPDRAAARLRSLVDVAWDEVRQGRFSAAEVHLQRALDADPSNTRLAGMLARARELAADLSSAEGSLAWAVLARRGAAAFIDGRDLREAAVFLRQAYQEAPEEARLLALLNRVEKAAKLPELTKASGLASSNGFVDERLRGARNAIYDGGYELGARRAREVLEVDPRNVRALEILGSARYLQGDLLEARAAWEEALRLEPGSRAVTEHLERIR